MTKQNAFLPLSNKKYSNLFTKEERKGRCLEGVTVNETKLEKTSSDLRDAIAWETNYQVSV